MRQRAEITPAADALRAFGRQLPDRPAAPPTFAGTLAAMAAVGVRFDLEPTWSGPLEDRILAADLTDAQIEHGVALRGAGLKADDPKIAANMWFQWYCYRMAAPLLAAWVFHRRIPDVSASNIAFRYDEEGRPLFTALVELRAAGLPGDRTRDIDLTPVPDLLPEIVRVLLDGHLLPLAERVKARFRLGAPIARGTIASQIGMALTAIDANTPTPWERVATDTLRILEFTAPQIDGLGRSGDLICKRTADRTGMTYRRGTCCLVYRIPEKEMCGGCPLRDDDDRAGVYTNRLAARPATSCT